MYITNYTVAHLAQPVVCVHGVPPEGEGGLTVPILHGHAVGEEHHARVQHVKAEGEELVAISRPVWTGNYYLFSNCSICS